MADGVPSSPTNLDHERRQLLASPDGDGTSDHGTFSPVDRSRGGSSTPGWPGEEGSYAGDSGKGVSRGSKDSEHDGISSAPVDGMDGMSITRQLARKHGVKKPWVMYAGCLLPHRDSEKPALCVTRTNACINY